MTAAMSPTGLTTIERASEHAGQPGSKQKEEASILRTILALVTFVTLSAVAPTDVLAQQPGEIVEFLIPSMENQPEPPSGPQDKLIYSGGQITTIDTTGCAIGTHPIQNAVLVDPAGGRSGRIVGVITSSQSDPVPPGTRLKNLNATGICLVSSNAVLYNRWQGTVE